MIFIKLALIAALCYLIGRSLSNSAEMRTKKIEEEYKDFKDKTKEYKALVEAEKRVLVDTIKKLKEEKNIDLETFGFCTTKEK